MTSVYLNYCYNKKFGPPHSYLNSEPECRHIFREYMKTCDISSQNFRNCDEIASFILYSCNKNVKEKKNDKFV